MLCKIKNCHKIGFGIFLSVFAVALSVFFSSDINAISDKSVTYSANSSFSSIFPDCTTSDCIKQYNYLIIKTSSSFNSNSVIYFDYACRVGNSTSRPYLSIPFVSSDGVFYIWQIPSCLSGSSNLVWGTSSPPVDITFTLTESYAVLPSGNLDISQNGEYNVSSYATVNVNVPPTVVQGDYHDDLVKINNSILVCGAICLVLYFFYCIYRLIIRNSGSS